MKMGSFGSLLLCGSLVLFLLSGLTAGEDTISASQTLVDGETMNSSSGVFQMGFFSPGRSTGRYLGIWYRNIDVQTVVWVANRKKPVTDSSGSLLLNSTGGLVLTSRGGAVVWSANTTGLVQNLVLQLLDNGNLVLRSAVDMRGSSLSGNFFWQSFDYPTDTFLPEMKLGWDLQTGINRRFSSWSSPEDPSPGDFTWGLENNNFPETTARKGASKYFRSGPWNGLRFSGAPQQSPNPIFWFEFVSNKDEVYYMYHVDNSSMLVRTTLNQSNYLWERSTWSPESKTWRVFLQLPKDYCDNYGLCGAYGKCVANNLPFCQCMIGFSPKSPNQWNTNDFLQGCIRNKPLSCPNNTDGFLKYSNIKLPDTTNCSVDATLSLKDCEKKCLSNCSCTAYTNSDIRGRGGGCAMWFGDLFDMRQYPDAGQDIYIRMPASEIGKSGRKAWMIAVVVLAVAILCGFVLVLCWFCRRKRNLRGNKEILFVGQENEGHEDDLELPLFDLALISEATNNFSTKNKLGEGGFGTVFKGVLDDGHEIAVKRLSASSTQGMHEFKNEVILIAKLQHRNLVKVLGCCIQGEEKMLIYEYMHNKSLDAFIFDPSRSKQLDWKRRLHIIFGVARGLLYLHQDSRLRIIHRDLKASNVLLDEEMNPKISDFGLARIFGGDQTEANTTRVVGTYGYMAPEYAIDGLFSVKSDVFSFGILILETVSGKRNRAFYHSNNSLVGHTWELYKTGESSELADPSLVDTCTISEVLRCIHIGLLCLQEHPDDRPTMSSVLVMLSSDGPLPDPKQPGFLAERKIRESSSLSSKHDSTSTNDISFTVLQPR